MGSGRARLIRSLRQIKGLGRGHPCDLLVENSNSFCLCTKNLSEVELKVNRLNFWGAEEISRQKRISASVEKAAIIVIGKKISCTAMRK